jgi:hypothetical protein
MMRKLRKLADLTGWTVENLIHEGILEDHQIPDTDAGSLQSESQTNAHLRSATGAVENAVERFFA